MKMNFSERIFFADGGMGTLLQKEGVKGTPELLNIENPELIKKIHRQYIDAGCDFITANTFGANKIKLEADVDKIVASAIAIAREAAGDKLVAVDIGPTGKLLKPMGELDFEDAYEAFSQVAVVAEKSGADIAVVETMTDTYEMKAAVLAVKENTSLPVFASFSFDADGKLLTGGNLEAAVALLEGLNVDVIGINCGFGPKVIKKFAEKLLEISSTPIMIMPNAGLPRIINGETVFDVDAEEFSLAMKEFAEMGVSILGGCCGTTPEHILKTVEKCKDIKPKIITDKNLTVVSSYAKAQCIGEMPVVIGERINPTGKKRLKQALSEKDFDYLVSQAYEQSDAGAHILDVNVGMPEIDEKSVMKEAIVKIQSAVSLPLQIDSASPDVLESALRIYNGKALLNSVNGKKEIMEKVFPIAKKYGAVIVGLTLDENGIPETAEGRLSIAEKIVNTAKTYGIDKKDIIIDALTLTVSAQPDAANVTTEAVRLIKEKLGVKTVLGVSNVSFGLPQREIINSVFYHRTLEAGLDAAILNPNSKPMMNVLYSHNALNGTDIGCEKYISVFSEQTTVEADVKESDLKTDIINGLSSSATLKTAELIKVNQSQEIINGYIVPALEKVGTDYESGKIFLPQLLKAAEAAQSAFAVIKESMQNEKATESKGKIVVATVKGDIHDIGKNIASVMLENYGYEVIDLGKDVEPEQIADTVIKNNVQLVGLSALMTTTVESMKETIELLRIKAPDCRIMVGGAVLTKELCEMLGADYFAFDAIEDIRIANEIFC